MSSIAAYKKDWTVCGGCCCNLNYIDCNPTVFVALEEECLCLATDCIFIGEDSRKPVFCGLLGAVVHPKVGFCKPLSYYYDIVPEIEAKKDYCVCNGICLGPVFHETNYVKMPVTCCRHEARTLCCCVTDCACPCADDIPSACGFCCGLICCPTCKCCPKVHVLFPNVNYIEVPSGLPASEKVVSEQPVSDM